ncbi:hypothetical protein H0A71_23135 [Alcaligenaceae bacterium]|nr:hypothetical protein [Alcaligenaceae bacterium]
MKPTLSKPTLSKKPDAALDFAEANIKKARESRVFNAPEGYRRLTINLREDLHKKLKIAAIEQDSTATDIIMQLLEQELTRIFHGPHKKG